MGSGCSVQLGHDVLYFIAHLSDTLMSAASLSTRKFMSEMFSAPGSSTMVSTPNHFPDPDCGGFPLFT